MIAALFVEKGGTYWNLEGVDPWDEARDARLYRGPHAVVAHPDCKRWGRYWHGAPNKPHQHRMGEDGGCFAAALDAVRTWGGVLEHPAGSRAWGFHGLLKPEPGRWAPSGEGWVCEVWQSAYGHRARKRTWLYYRGDRPPVDPLWLRPSGTHQVGWTDQRGKARNKPTLSKREANATPEAFASYLIGLAANSRLP